MEFVKVPNIVGSESKSESDSYGCFFVDKFNQKLFCLNCNYNECLFRRIFFLVTGCIGLIGLIWGDDILTLLTDCLYVSYILLIWIMDNHIEYHLKVRTLLNFSPEMLFNQSKINQYLQKQ